LQQLLDQILKIIITESTMALSFVFLTLKQKIKSIRKIYFYNNHEKTDMILIYEECGKILRTPFTLI
jgi:hypothetical protein